ncbi:hypothetical protein ACFLR1_05505 [Bacteroidota bacterium]
MSNKKENTKKKEWKKPQVKELSTSASKGGPDPYDTAENIWYHPVS